MSRRSIICWSNLYFIVFCCVDLQILRGLRGQLRTWQWTGSCVTSSSRASNPYGMADLITDVGSCQTPTAVTFSAAPLHSGEADGPGKCLGDDSAWLALTHAVPPTDVDVRPSEIKRRCGSGRYGSTRCSIRRIGISVVGAVSPTVLPHDLRPKHRYHVVADHVWMMALAAARAMTKAMRDGLPGSIYGSMSLPA